jgi:uncharacterized membrane protein YeaQ/YmgE (transglycosylase-associated protein family)
MSIFWTLVIGLAAGAVAKLLMPGRDIGGFFITMALGVLGAFVATWIGQMLGWYAPGESAGFFGAIVGSIIILALYRLLLRRPA